MLRQRDAEGMGDGGKRLLQRFSLCQARPMPAGGAHFLPALFAPVGEVPATLKARSLVSVFDPRSRGGGEGQRTGRSAAQYFSGLRGSPRSIRTIRGR